MISQYLNRRKGVGYDEYSASLIPSKSIRNSLLSIPLVIGNYWILDVIVSSAIKTHSMVVR